MTPPTRAAEHDGEAPFLQIGGEIHRVAILTIGLNPCACYLARRLRGSGADIFLVNQRQPRIKRHSFTYFRKLLSRRGAWITIDYFLFFVVKELILAVKRLGHGLGRSGSGRGTMDDAAGHESRTPVLRPDPEVIREPWLTYMEVDNITKRPDRDRLQAIQPDLILLSGAPIISSRTIRCAKVACMNPHSGISPDFAGSSASHWAILAGRFEDIGYTVHLVIPKVDSGPVLWQERVEWDHRRPLPRLAPNVTQRMYDKMAEIALAMIRGETFQAKPQTERETVRPPAGLFVRLLAELRRMRYSARRGRPEV